MEVKPGQTLSASNSKTMEVNLWSNIRVTLSLRTKTSVYSGSIVFLIGLETLIKENYHWNHEQ